jgi:hypothetical protein
MQVRTRPLRSALAAIALGAVAVAGCSNAKAGESAAPATANPTATTAVVVDATNPDTPDSTGSGSGSTGSGSTGSGSTGSGSTSSSGSIRTRAEADSAIGTAVSFMQREVGMTRPVASNFRWTGSRTAKLDIRARIEGRTGPLTTVSLRRLAKVWYVEGTSARQIRVTRPGVLTRIGSPVRVSGRALAFEGNVSVRVTEDRYGPDRLLGSGHVTGGGDQPRPFSGTVAFARPAPGTTGSVVFAELSAVDGTAINATVVRVRFARPSPLSDRVSDPKVAGDRLVKAWLAGDRAAAAKVATSKVVSGLFAADRSGQEVKWDSRCRNVAPATFSCIYDLEPGQTDLALIVEGGASAGYIVTSFEFAP